MSTEPQDKSTDNEIPTGVRIHYEEEPKETQPVIHPSDVEDNDKAEWVKPKKRFFIKNDSLSFGAGDDVKCYNPTLIRHNGRTYMFYRYEPSPGCYYTDIAMAEISTGGSISGTPRKLRIPRTSAAVCTLDDPRAYVWRGNLWLMVTQSTETRGKNGMWAAHITLNRIDLETGNTLQTIKPDIGHNHNLSSGFHGIKCEKNWVPIVNGDSLYFIYSIDPLKIAVWNDKRKNLEMLVSHQDILTNLHYINDRKQRIYRGSTNFVEDCGDYIGMWHASSMMADGRRKYYAGFMKVNLDDREKKFTVTVNAGNTLVGEDGGELDIRLKQEPHSNWKPKVVFPCGILDDGRYYVVSSGWNDCRCELIYFDKEATLKTLESAS